MSIFVHQIRALQFQENPSEKFLQKHISLFMTVALVNLSIYDGCKAQKKFATPIFLDLKKKRVFEGRF